MKFDSIQTIDCHYYTNEFAAAYLLQEGDDALFVDNNTNFAIPYLLSALASRQIPKENVKYLIITHIHLDHAGATSRLVQEFPNAIVLAHPKAAPHIINPKRIIESASMVYGKENFEKMYGEILEVPSARVRVMSDGEVLKFGSRELTFIYTRGHANHHFVILDSKTNSIFTGDSFGISYPCLKQGSYPFLFPSTTPTDFHADEARLSIEKILNTKADNAYLTHFDIWLDMKSGSEQMLLGIDRMEKIFLDLVKSNKPDSELQTQCENQIMNFYEEEFSKRKIPLSVLTFLKPDAMINAQGLVFAANRAKKKGTV
ncbi:MAG: MBL fold metallo-hydrolase [Leptospiraceae bacterium]|nr:MBL fold metallo-hydrolase [Leptospiraceae bacterium]